MRNDLRGGATEAKPGKAAAAPGTAKSGLAHVPTIDPMKQCISDWDKGTHITPQRWREICQERWLGYRASMPR